MSDLNFDKIIEKLQEIHILDDNLRFGMIVQTAVDRAKSNHNIDFHDMNSKEILTALTNFHDKLKGGSNGK